MVRGVSRQIVEVVDTGSEEFERAILFVHPDCRTLGGDALDGRARACLGRMQLRPKSARRRRWPVVLGGLAVFLLGMAAGMLLLPLLG